MIYTPKGVGMFRRANTVRFLESVDPNTIDIRLGIVAVLLVALLLVALLLVALLLALRRRATQAIPVFCEFVLPPLALPVPYAAPCLVVERLGLLVAAPCSLVERLGLLVRLVMLLRVLPVKWNAAGKFRF